VNAPARTANTGTIQHFLLMASPPLLVSLKRYLIVECHKCVEN
jgi:hypothetical protein